MYVLLDRVAIIDGDIYPAQFDSDRIKTKRRANSFTEVFGGTAIPLHKPVAMAGLLDPYTRAYPEKVRSKVEIVFKDEKKLKLKKKTTLVFTQDRLHGNRQ
jgi:2-methylcitrate dehydratase